MTLPLIEGPVWLQALVGGASGLVAMLLVRAVERWLRRRRFLSIQADAVYCTKRRWLESDRSLRARCKAAVDAVSRGPWAGL